MPIVAGRLLRLPTINESLFLSSLRQVIWKNVLTCRPVYVSDVEPYYLEEQKQ